MESHDIRTILFMGRPGSGKETQARRLAERLGYHFFSTGEKFREMREHRDALGERVKAEYDTGKLLPVWFAEYLFENELFKLAPNAGIVFEGTGRWREEAERFHEVTSWLGRAYRVIYLDISVEEAMKRQKNRAIHTERTDSDTDAKVKVRLEEYDHYTATALDFFREKGMVIEIDGARSIEAIAEEIVTALHV